MCERLRIATENNYRVQWHCTAILEGAPMPINVIEAFGNAAWDLPFSAQDQKRALEALEAGRVLYFKQLAFPLDAGELQCLSSTSSDQKAKNISFDPGARELKGAKTEDSSQHELMTLMDRYATRTRGF